MAQYSSEELSAGSLLPKFNVYNEVPRYVAMYELRMDDKVIPCSTDPKVKGKTFTVTDLHPDKIRGEYQTVAATLWDGWREFTSRTLMFQLIERRWN